MLRELVEQKYAELQDKLYLKKCSNLDKQAAKVAAAVKKILGEDIAVSVDYENGAVLIDGFEFTLTNSTLTGIIPCSDCGNVVERFQITDVADFSRFMFLGEHMTCDMCDYVYEQSKKKFFLLRWLRL